MSLRVDKPYSNHSVLAQILGSHDPLLHRSVQLPPTKNFPTDETRDWKDWKNKTNMRVVLFVLDIKRPFCSSLTLNKSLTG